MALRCANDFCVAQALASFSGHRLSFAPLLCSLPRDSRADSFARGLASSFFLLVLMSHLAGVVCLGFMMSSKSFRFECQSQGTPKQRPILCRLKLSITGSEALGSCRARAGCKHPELHVCTRSPVSRSLFVGAHRTFCVQRPGPSSSLAA